jgi:hypothetical protein
MTALKARNGEYRLNNANPVADLPSGSVVLFRFGLHKIIGEAVVVRTEVFQEDDAEVPATVWFAPSSIRVFAPPIAIATLQKIIGGTSIKDISSMANAYAKFDDWSLYGKLLSAHLTAKGCFL